MKIIKFIIISWIFVLVGCLDEQPVTIPKFEAPDTEKTVLLEEFTGANCVNCPEAAKIVKDLELKYGKSLITIAIHAGSLAEPVEEESKYDFNCEDGTKIEKAWQYYGKPAAMINRGDYGDIDGSPIRTGADSWDALIEQELKKEVIFNLNTSVSYNEETRELKGNCIIIPLKNLEGDYRINIAVTESKIIDAHKVRGEDGEIKTEKEYEYNHVLRDMITAWDGKNIGDNLKKDDIIEYEFSYTLPNDDKGLWNAENIHIVSFLTGGENGMSPVHNAVKTHLK